ncbi:MAG: sigma-54 dependent transcriptional regulator [Deltaproteobacteria bacterium]|nr:sigma-54 dependent transcriptional regulator [Deltaproteobacteria bacterium]
MSVSILLVDDDYDHRSAYGIILKDMGFNVTMAKNGLEGASWASKKKFDLILMDVRMDGLNGLETLAYVKKGENKEKASLEADTKNEQTPVIMFTGYGTVSDAVEAMKMGAYDFLIKGDLDIDVLKLKIDNALEHFKLKEEKKAGIIGDHKVIVGSSSALNSMLRTIEKVATTDSTVLITGESGVGKELVARTIWAKSNRAGHVFLTCNCTSVYREQVEDTLFGHKKGAFTGANSDRPGIIKHADGGTVFLDEIGETSPEFQVKILRTLQEGEIQPLGTDEAIKVNVRFIAATNRNLEEEVANKFFRLDLFHRLTFVVRVPPLRERVEDLEELSLHFIKRQALKNGKKVASIDHKALEIIKGYHWPGNVRELENVMEWAVIMASGDEVKEGDLPEKLILGERSTKIGVPLGAPLPKTLAAAECEAVSYALDYFDGHKQKTADFLGVTRRTLYTKINSCNLTKYAHASEEEYKDDSGG